MKRQAWIAGASGLVGQALVQQLLVHPAYEQVTAWGRRPLQGADPGLIEVRWPQPQEAVPLLARRVDDGFCCLGTTLEKAGSRAAFTAVDLDLVVDFAHLCHAHGARRFVVISAVGAAADSLSFYARTKGRMEAALARVGFDALHIVRPSLLLGARAESRWAEDLGQKIAPLIAPLLSGRLARFRPVRAQDVAQAMLEVAQRQDRGVEVHHLPLQ
ncbi:NAD-dependent epimerase/dehydratase family protein [Sinimarinibacterium sp. NLF-5-8]|uniref:NAD-dependent epimerase/dehydratase family protein n=1 Tax=Sinimarinibacterium sp. NLF-5-8 TaxID=2698684 RepID=UPI00137B93F2|nr:NAD-dependent epimerase/dehydratase family protein [Sinimarinibacterium sp. NLF-5-8]QHS10770.1 NAD-dependent epimerase/dehydratase family protein [Sinimarinibacterium sp. NLF-5-8]